MPIAAPLLAIGIMRPTSHGWAYSPEELWRSNINPPHAAPVHSLSQVRVLLRSEVAVHPWQAWIDLNLTMPQFKLLLLVVSGNGLRVGDLAQRMGVTPPTITTILDRLVDQGLVRREDDPVDRRLVIARPTAQGKALLQALNIVADAELHECAQDLSPEDLHCLTAGMAALQRSWDARHETPDQDDTPEAC